MWSPISRQACLTHSPVLGSAVQPTGNATSAQDSMLGSGLLASTPPAMMPGMLSQVKRESFVAALWPGKHMAGFEVSGGVCSGWSWESEGEALLCLLTPTTREAYCV